MKAETSFSLNLAGALLIVIASAAIAAAQTGTDTCAGLNATIGGTCTPLTNTTSGNNGNTAYGWGALQNNASGILDTAVGNTATGAGALENNTAGGENTATGNAALGSNTGGVFNTATGVGALLDNTQGGENTATGADALSGNSTGSNNTATGVFALEASDTGSNNTATGNSALQRNTTGGSNIGIGNQAGSNLTTGDNNIDIGNAGVVAESATIRIGGGKQTATFIGGIFSSPGTKKACQVVVQSNAKLGCMASSARYKHDIRDMSDASDKLMKLRPVIFKYKGDSDGIRQYGLIAEEVEKVYPELVIDGSDGRAQTVAYQELPAMLLNEVQKEHRQLAQKDAEIAAMRRQLAALQKKNSEIDTMAERLDALERQARASQAGHLAVALH